MAPTTTTTTTTSSTLYAMKPILVTTGAPTIARDSTIIKGWMPSIEGCRWSCFKYNEVITAGCPAECRKGKVIDGKDAAGAPLNEQG